MAPMEALLQTARRLGRSHKPSWAGAGPPVSCWEAIEPATHETWALARRVPPKHKVERGRLVVILGKTGLIPQARRAQRSQHLLIVRQ